MLELTLMEHGAVFPDLMRAVLDRFERETRVKVNLRILTWQDAWSELVRVGLYGDGPHVSEIGSTWLSEFVGMGALRPFSAADLSSLGGAAQFLPSAWNSGLVATASGLAQTIWAVPWAANTRLIYYRQDVFEQAGVDPQTAFQTPQALLAACVRFQSAGIANPFGIPTRFTHITLHNVASWVWGSGGDFLSPDCRQVAFTSPAARAGIYAYCELVKYLSPAARNLDDHGVHAAYRRGELAATLTGTWLQGSVGMRPEVAATTRHALPPGVPYLGGSQLVIWKHVAQPASALALVRYLASAEVQLHFAHQVGLLPTRLDALAQDLFQSDPFYQRAANSLRQARAFPAFPLWGLVENKLTDAFTAIWTNLLSTSDPDIPAIVDKHLNDVAKRLNPTLASY